MENLNILKKIKEIINGNSIKSSRYWKNIYLTDPIRIIIKGQNEIQALKIGEEIVDYLNVCHHNISYNKILLKDFHRKITKKFLKKYKELKDKVKEI